MNSQPRLLPLTAITDKPEIGPFLATVPGLRPAVLDISRIGQRPLPGAPIVVFDVDLTNPARITQVKTLLSSLNGHAKRIFLVDKGEHHQTTQAKGLGAACVVPRPLTLRNLDEALKLCKVTEAKPVRVQAPRAHQTPAPADAEKPSIAAAAEALSSVFSSLTHAALIDMASVNEASDAIIDTVAHVGIDRWLHSVRTHHVGTFQHCLLVTGVATAFGQTLSLPKGDLQILTSAALLHDIGKARIPLNILNKVGHLTEEEFAIIKMHPVYGYDYLKTQADVPEQVLHAVRHHHEYLNGTGYPDGLTDSQICDITRILTVCDIYGALIEKRAYKKPRTPEEAMVILRDLAETGRIDRALTRALDASVC